MSKFTAFLSGGIVKSPETINSAPAKSRGESLSAVELPLAHNLLNIIDKAAVNVAYGAEKQSAMPHHSAQVQNTIGLKAISNTALSNEQTPSTTKLDATLSMMMGDKFEKASQTNTFAPPTTQLSQPPQEELTVAAAERLVAEAYSHAPQVNSPLADDLSVADTTGQATQAKRSDFALGA